MSIQIFQSSLLSPLLRSACSKNIHLGNLIIAPQGRLRRLMMASQHATKWQNQINGLDSKQVDSYIKEKLIKVNESDTVIGSISKGEAHAIETVRNKVYHRALSVLIFDDQSRFLLTQRASSKITFPNYFTNACCSHPMYDEQELEDDGQAIGVRRAAIRRLNYELGTDVNDINNEDLMLVNRLAYRAESDGGRWGEAEIDYIFILKKNLKLRPNPEEVKSYRYVTKAEMDDLILRPIESDLKITPWMKLLARDLLLKYWNNLHSLETIAKPDTIIRYEDLIPVRDQTDR